MAITYLMIVIFMAILGIVFLCGKGAMLIAGYNTASPEERAEMDENSSAALWENSVLPWQEDG